jgi:hypothetical protein
LFFVENPECLNCDSSDIHIDAYCFATFDRPVRAASTALGAAGGSHAAMAENVQWIQRCAQGAWLFYLDLDLQIRLSLMASPWISGDSQFTACK